MKKLTIKQEKFAQQYVLTGNASEAFRQSYDSKNMKSETVTEKASRLLKQYNISTRVKELQKEQIKAFTVSAEDKKKVLWDLIVTCAETDDESNKIKNPNAVISAISELNKMDGDLAAIKTQLSGNLSVSHEDMLDKLK